MNAGRSDSVAGRSDTDSAGIEAVAGRSDAVPVRADTIVGRSVTRPDLLAKVTGSAQYAGDFNWPGMLYGRIKRCEVAHAKIVRIDTTRALVLPGVKAVLTHQNVPRVLHAGSPAPRSISVSCDQYILDDTVRYWGEGVAAVAAVSEEVAQAALDLIEVEYEVLPAVFTVEDAQREDAPLIHDRGFGRNLVDTPHELRRGDVDKGFAEAAFLIEGEYTTGRPTPAYMEPNVCACHWDAHGKLTVQTSTQAAFMVRGTLAEVLGLPLNKVRVLCEHMGGGFGAKQDLFQHEFLCALLARQTGRPVRMEYTREETFLGGRTRHPASVWLKQGFRKDGTLCARQARVVFNSGAYGSQGPGVTIVGAAALFSLYRCENVHLQARCVYTNSPIAGAFRGYGVVQTYFALDVQMDEAAHALGIDPVRLKHLNAVREGDIAPSNHPLIGDGLRDCIAHGRELLDWDAVRARPRPSGVVRTGWGMGCEMHGSSAYPGIKEQGNAIVRLNEDGTAVLFTGTAALGTGVHTALTQIVAQELGLRFEQVSCVHGDTDVVPWDIGAFASHSTFVGGRAAQLAAGEVKAKVIAHAAMLMSVDVKRLDMRDGVIFVTDAPDIRLDVKDAVSAHKGTPAPPLVATASYHPTKSYSFGAHFVEVKVDTETGQIAVAQVLAVHEIGKVIHPVGAAGQIEGGIQQGIGHTLYEDYRIDMKTGRSLNANFVDYKMPLSMDMPPIRTVLLQTAPDPGGPFGAKGVGEDPIIAIGPAIANAIHDAIGVRFRHFPILPEQVLAALHARTRNATGTSA